MRRLVVLVACLLNWLAAAPCLAQPAQGEPSANISADPQRGELAAAIAAYEAGDFERAKELFERVHAAAPTARTLRSLALVAYRQGRYAEALALFEASLNSPAKPLSAEMREDLQGLMSAARAELEREEADGALAAAAAPTAAPGAQAKLEPERQFVAGPPAKSAPKALSTRARRLRRAGYALLGVAGAALLGGGAALITGALRVNDIEAICRENRDHQCSPEAVDKAEHDAKLDLLRALAATGFALAGASAVASATTLTLSFRPGRGSERHMPVAVLTFRTTF